MKRVSLAALIPLSVVAVLGAAASAWGAIDTFTINNVLDDTCDLYVNGTFETVVTPLTVTPRIPVGAPNVPGRTNILLRCHDGGVYGTSIEATWRNCNFRVDEEGGGLRGKCTL